MSLVLAKQRGTKLSDVMISYTDHNVVQIPGTQTEYVLDLPESKTNRAILFVPGMSGEALGERYIRLAELATAEGFALMRSQGWKDSQDLLTKSLKGIHDDLLACVAFLRTEGYTDLSAIGKSLGGALLLYGGFKDFNRMVLWAPAANVAAGGTVDALWETPFSKIDSLGDLSISTAALAELDSHVLLIHGTEDAAIPFENMQMLQASLKYAELERVMGMGHSPKTTQEGEILFSKSISYIKQ